jgi:hypothetical protein
MPAGYRPYVSPAGIAATGTGTSVSVGGSTDHVFVIILITGTATAVIEGSLDDVSFTAVSPSLTSSTIYQLDHRVPYYRVRVTAYTSGVVTAQFGPSEGRHGFTGNIAPELATAGGPP